MLRSTYMMIPENQSSWEDSSVTPSYKGYNNIFDVSFLIQSRIHCYGVKP